MALTSQDETDLILPLYQGARENPRFATFLERLRRRTEAEYIAIAIRRSDVPRAATTRFHAGADIHAAGIEADGAVGVDGKKTIDILGVQRLDGIGE